MAARSTPTPVVETKTPRVRRTQAERSAEARQALVDAAIAAIHEYGYAGATTAAIADRAGVSRALITHHFGTRAQLMADVVATVYERERHQFLEFETTMGRGLRVTEWPEMLWDVLSTPAGSAVVEIFQATRNDPDLKLLVAPLQQQIETHSMERLRSRVGADDRDRMLAATRLLTWAIRGLGIARLTVTDDDEIRQSVLALKTLLEIAVASGQLAETLSPSPQMPIA